MALKSVTSNRKPYHQSFLALSSKDQRRSETGQGENTCVIDHIDNRKVSDLVYDLVQVLIHLHALPVTVLAKPDADYSAFFAEDCLVDVPA